MKKIFLLGLLLFSVLGYGVQAQDNSEFVSVFIAGDDGYKSYRIPAIVKSKKGTLLAFAEGRVNGASDHGNLDIVLKRSVDGGKTWEKLQVVADDGVNQCGNPAPVVLASGRVLLLSCGSTASEGEVMAGKATREVYMQYSDNDGKTWSKRRKITNQASTPDFRWYATGPCNAIQLKEGKYKGRIIVPANHSDSTRTYYAHNFYSDDQGKTWKLGTTAGRGSNESSVAEVAPNLVVQNMRMQTDRQGKRGVRTSTDGGATWTETTHDPNLTCPRCQGSIVRDYSSPNRLYFSNPGQLGARKEMTVRASADGGKTWPKSTVVYNGAAAYSNLVVLAPNKVGILFEMEDGKPYRIVWKNVKFD